MFLYIKTGIFIYEKSVDRNLSLWWILTKWNGATSYENLLETFQGDIMAYEMLLKKINKKIKTLFTIINWRVWNG